MIRCYYTLNELCISTGEPSWSNRLLTEWGLPSIPNESDEQKNLFKICSDNYGDENIVYVDVYGDVCPTIEQIKYDLPDLKAEIVTQLRKIARYIVNSAVRYEKLITLYDDNANKLLSKIESTVQFNDTPQTTVNGLDGDGYATTYTKSGTDATTLMNRLAEIRSLWTNMYDEWAEEFAKKFVL